MEIVRSWTRISRRAWVFGALVLAWSLAGCVTVRPQDKELLADPAMIYGAEGSAGRQEQHVLDNRQGARSASGSGGGCGCN